jgi:hypothetical protein
MHKCKVHYETWMLGKPCVDFLAMMRTDVVTHEMNRTVRCTPTACAAANCEAPAASRRIIFPRRANPAVAETGVLLRENA